MKITVKDFSGQMVLTKDLPDDRSRISVGRSEENDIVLQHPEISPEHFSIDADSSGVFISDSNSINGVTLDGRRIGAKPVRIFAGSEICAGELIFEISSDRLAHREAGTVKTPLVRMLLIVCLILVVPAIMKVRSTRKPPVDTAPLLLSQGSGSAEIDQLLVAGQKAYFLNNTTEAVELFNKVISLDPANRRALDFLAELRRQNLESLLVEARSAMDGGRFDRSARLIELIKVLAPDDLRFAELTALQDGEEGFARAKLLFDRGDFAGAREILQKIKILDESRRRRWLRETEMRLSMLTELHEAEEKLNAGDLSGALALLEAAGGADAADNPLAAEISRLKSFAGQVLDFTMAITNGHNALAIQLGRGLQGRPEIQRYDGVQEMVKSGMNDLKEKLLNQVEELKASVGQVVEQADIRLEAGDASTGHDLMFKALQDQTVIEFLSPSKQATALRIDLQSRMRDYVKEVYQRGYILTGMGRFDEAQELFAQAVRFTNPGDEYHQKALVQLGRIRRRIPAGL